MSYSLPSQHYTTPLSCLTLYLVNIIPHLYHVLLFTQHYTTPLSRLTLYLVNIIPHLYHVLLFT